MSSQQWVRLCGVTAAAGVLCGAIALKADPPTAAEPKSEAASPAASGGEAGEAPRVSIAVARERAKLMHNIYTATLDVMHHHYFHRNRAVVPARAMEDVFAAMSEQSQGTARWIAVNTKAMSVDHEPQSEFEKAAARELAGGKKEFEQVEDGQYYRAAPIPLRGGCVGCHVGFSKDAGKSPRFAGLVIALPVLEESL